MDKRSSAEPVTERAAVPVVNVQVGPEFSNTINQARLRMVAEGVLFHERTPGEATLVVTDDKSIQGLNRDYLGIDAPTDVLSFSAQEEVGPDVGGLFVDAPEAEGYLGDVIISFPRALAQAEEQGHSAEEELELLVVHGILHLLGYDHTTEAEKAVMWARQEEILTLPTSAKD